MTLTETRPERAETDQRQTSTVYGDGWVSTADHKRIGRYYIAAAFLFLLVGGVVGLVLSIEQAERGGEIVGDEYGRVFSLHATAAAILFLGPLWTGIATYIVPLQIGAPRLAFSRLHATAFWLYLVGGGIVLAAYIVDAPKGAGLTLSAPIPAPGNDATALWVMGLLLVAISGVIAAANLLTTILKLRTDGMTLPRTPLFTWSVLVSSAATVLATPAFVAGLVLLYLDLRYGGDLFSRPGGRVVWQHTLWLFGRPDVYLLVLPALGAACDIVSHAARRTLVGANAARGLLVAVGVLSFGAWAHGTGAADAVVLPTYSPLTALIAAPVGLLILMWLGTLAGTKRFRVSLLFVVGAVLLFGFALINTGVAALREVDGGSAWSTGHVHVGIFGIPLLLAAGALHHWSPRLSGRSLSAGLGSLTFLLLLGGLLILGLGYYLLGYDGAPWHRGSFEEGSWETLAKVAAAGGLLTTLGVLALIADLLPRRRRDATTAEDVEPYDGMSLEWSTTAGDRS